MWLAYVAGFGDNGRMAKKGKDKANGDRTIALNKRARHDYHLEQRFEAGMALQGWELKAIRAGRAYANVHSTLFLPGEIRGQIHDERRPGRR